MAISQAMCSSFKVDLLSGRHNFLAAGGIVYKIALYTSASNIGAATTQYGGASSTNEVAATGGYTAGGVALTKVDPVAAASPITTAITDFSNDPTWSSSTITARGALIYNDTATTPLADIAVAALDFGADKVSSAGDFIIQFPVADGTNAIIRIA